MYPNRVQNQPAQFELVPFKNSPLARRHRFSNAAPRKNTHCRALLSVSGVAVVFAIGLGARRKRHSVTALLVVRAVNKVTEGDGAGSRVDIELFDLCVKRLTIIREKRRGVAIESGVIIIIIIISAVVIMIIDINYAVRGGNVERGAVFGNGFDLHPPSFAVSLERGLECGHRFRSHRLDGFQQALHRLIGRGRRRRRESAEEKGDC
mmetsp:Transcript_7330/g.12114  ORF Transcript_7330/g.12114 Transcript_7330/m.12114 type:complete len:207 (-) Transcript_7330:73-693(-)